ncbi:MAG: hypothetical protein D6746_07035 [Bacteroidetes bacterium]|nr:MAG: hypothetical protein D6746_07035 [Bacteroidota bacterium]
MNQIQFYQWSAEVRKRFDGLKKWQAIGLVLISYGIIKARRAQASVIAEELPSFGKASTVERRIQRWITNRRIDVEATCQSWMRWVFERYQGAQIFLLVDETKISDRIACMMISLAIEKRAIPLLWRCYRANSAADYPSEGQVAMISNMLKQVLTVLPGEKPVIVEADRGIGYSSNLMREVAALGAYFLFRVQKQAIFTSEQHQSVPLHRLAHRGEAWHGQGTLFTQQRAVDCTLHVLWDENQAEPWYLATNLPTLRGEEYALRIWQEESFRDLKSGGWQWQNCLTRNPAIMERFLLPMTLAYAWCVSLGLLFRTLEKSVRSTIDYSRKHSKYSVFRIGLRFFKRTLFTDPSKIPLQIGPFLSPV